MAVVRLGELLVAAGSITEEELQRGLDLQKGSNDRLGSVLIKNKIITEKQLIEALQMQLGIEYIDLSKEVIPIEMAQTVPKIIAKKYKVVPVKIVRNELYLAMNDPLNFYALEEVKKAVHKKIVPLVAMASAVDHAISVLYGNEGAAKAIEEMKKEAVGNTSLPASEFASNKLLDSSVNNAPTIRLVNSILDRAILEHASDIHMEPHEKEYHIRMRIDGMMREILTIPAELQNSVISRFKVMAGLDIAERRIPQDGRFQILVKDRNIDLRVSTLPTIYGEKIVARILDRSQGIISKEAIGLTGNDLEKYSRMIRAQSGVILIVGPTGSGKTTTMYTMIDELNTDEVNLVTLEDPVEYNIDGTNQVQINEKTGMTFANGLRAILRQDPDIIAVGEIRDGETAEIAMRAAITGHKVLSTVHTSDAIGTIERLMNIGVEPYMISSALKGIISQRLMRRICPKCRMAYEASEDEKESLGIHKEEFTRIYKGKGCPECFYTGYRGRIAAFEMISITGEVRELILNHASRAELERNLRNPESGFVSLYQNAKRLVLEGTTSVDEMVRVVNEVL